MKDIRSYHNLMEFDDDLFADLETRKAMDQLDRDQRKDDIQMAIGIVIFVLFLLVGMARAIYVATH